MYKLLIVDDEEIIRVGLKHAVSWEKLGFTVTATAANGLEALKIIEQNPVDAMLIDIRMPKMSGLQLAQHIFQKNPSIKIVILSGYSDFHYAQEAINYSVFAYLLKPSKEQDIIRVFEKLKQSLDRERSEHESIMRKDDIVLAKTIMDIIIGSREHSHEYYDLSLEIYPEVKECYKSIMIIEIISLRPENHQNNFTGFMGSFTEKAISALQQQKNQDLLFVPFSMVPGEIILIIGSYRKEEIKYEAQCVFDHMQNSLSEYESLALVGGISDVFIDINDLHSFYNSVREILMHKTYMGLNRLLLKPDIALNKTKPLNLPFEQLSIRIANAVVSGRYEDGREVVNQIFDKIKELKIIDMELVQSLLHHMSYLIEKELVELGVSKQKIWDPEENFVENLGRLGSFDNMRRYAEILLLKAVEKYRENEDDPVSMLIRDAVNVINNSYGDQISLESVAQQLNISPAYLSRLFKKELNVNFKEYLIDVRINRAKELLKNIRLKIYEVADQVGYVDQRYFSEAFRSKTGITPMEYRKRVSENNEDSERI